MRDADETTLRQQDNETMKEPDQLTASTAHRGEDEATKEQDGPTAWDVRAQAKPRCRRVLSSCMIGISSTMTANRGDSVVLVLTSPLEEQLTSCFGTL